MKVLFGLATICITIGAALLGGWSGGLLAFGLMVFVLIWMLNGRPPLNHQVPPSSRCEASPKRVMNSRHKTFMVPRPTLHRFCAMVSSGTSGLRDGVGLGSFPHKEKTRTQTNLTTISSARFLGAAICSWSAHRPVAPSACRFPPLSAFALEILGGSCLRR